jgi:hypothetical protein
MSDTPQTDATRWHVRTPGDPLGAEVVHASVSENIERQVAEVLHKLEIAMAANRDVERIARERNEAREQLASEKSTRNAIIAKGIETERQLAEAREENAKLREAVKDSRDCILRLLDNGHDDGCEWINYANAACTCGVDDGHIVLSKLQPFVAP